MKRELLIAAIGGEVQAAMLEDGALVDLTVERQSRASIVGNIYLGRIHRVAPALAAAFVDIGLARHAFLPLGSRSSGGVGGDAADAGAVPHVSPAEGAVVCVQVVRDANRTKGPLLSQRLSLAGGRMVLLPGGDRIAVSRLIEEEGERARLAAVVSTVAHGDEGFVIRTAAEGIAGDELLREAGYLRAEWNRIVESRGSAVPPALLYREPGAIERVLRDHGLAGVDEIRVEGAAAFAHARDFLRCSAPDVASRLSMHRGPSPLFDSFGIENALDDALKPNVSLPSGGGIVVETTEALTSIDVNSGSLTQPMSQAEAALRTNLEAAREIAHQIRLRNLGGLIVIDFISMDSEGDWELVLERLAVGLARDRVPTRLFGRTSAGLVELTRRRQRVSIAEALTEPCPDCQGGGRVPTVETVAHGVLRRLSREARIAPAGTLVVSATPEVLERVEAICEGGISALEGTLGRQIRFQPIAGSARDQVDLHVA